MPPTTSYYQDENGNSSDEVLLANHPLPPSPPPPLSSILLDINHFFKHPVHFITTSQLEHNSTIVVIPQLPTSSLLQIGESFEEEVDHLLIFLTLFFPLLIGLSVIGIIAYLCRKMRKSGSIGNNIGTVDNSLGDRSFSSLPVPKGFEEEIMLGSTKYYYHSLSMPHLADSSGTFQNSPTVSFPQFLAIESYYNYPSAASILDETFLDVVDQSKFNLDSSNSNDGSSPTLSSKKPRSLKRSLSLKSFRKFRSRVLRFLHLRKRRQEAEVTVGSTPQYSSSKNSFNLVNLSTETRQQLKQIYVY